MRDLDDLPEPTEDDLMDLDHDLEEEDILHFPWPADDEEREVEVDEDYLRIDEFEQYG